MTAATTIEAKIVAMTVASFHLAHFPLRRSISRLLVVPAERWEITEAEGCVLGKVMGTSKEGTTKTSVEIRRWALFAVWNSVEDRDRFMASSTLMNRWRSSAVSLDHYALEPIASHGSWDGVSPFADLPSTRVDAEQIAVLTRAAVRWRRIWRFTRSIGPVDAELFAQPGCKLALGMGEWPIGEQATFSIWSTEAAIRAFAYESAAHKDVIERRATENWYSEEMFTRFWVKKL